MLPPELARLRAQDEAMHREAAKRAGLRGKAMQRHLQEDLAERDRDAYHGPRRAGRGVRGSGRR